jgi:hypothetical protein
MIIEYLANRSTIGAALRQSMHQFGVFRDFSTIGPGGKSTAGR